MIKLCSTVLNAIKTVTDSCNMRDFYKFIKSVTRVGAPFITSRHFHDLVQQKCDGKFSRMCTAANNDPTVAAARATADHQEGLYMEDLTRDTPQGNEPTPAGNYHAPDTIDAQGRTIVNSYFKLWTSAMTIDQQISWLTIHAQLFQQTQKKMKDSETVSTFVDRTLRIVQEDWQSTLMPMIPDWLLAHLLFANLTDELKNDMNDVYASYFQNGQRSFQSWCYSDVFSMATKCESNPKFQAEKRQRKQITRSISAVDFTDSGTSQNTKDDNDQGTDHNGTISRNTYYDVHRKKYDSMSPSELKAYHAKIKQIREKLTQIPDADGQIQYTMKKKLRACCDITDLPGFQSCNSPGHDAFSCTLNKQLVQPCQL